MSVGTGARTLPNHRGARYMGFRKSLGAIAIALPVIGCVWTVYANTVGASIYPQRRRVGRRAGHPASPSRQDRPNFASRFEPLAAAAAAAPKLMAHLALKNAMARQGGVQVASADPGDVPVTASVQAANAAAPQASPVTAITRCSTPIIRSVSSPTGSGRRKIIPSPPKPGPTSPRRMSSGPMPPASRRSRRRRSR